MGNLIAKPSLEYGCSDVGEMCEKSMLVEKFLYIGEVCWCKYFSLAYRKKFSPLFSTNIHSNIIPKHTMSPTFFSPLCFCRQHLPPKLGISQVLGCIKCVRSHSPCSEFGRIPESNLNSLSECIFISEQTSSASGIKLSSRASSLLKTCVGKCFGSA